MNPPQRPTRPAPHAWPFAPLALTVALTLATAWPAVGAHAQASTPAPLEVNLASEPDLDSLRGVGPALTARILAQRAEAPFADWTDLIRRVKGISPTTAGHLAAQGLTVNGQGPRPHPAPDASADLPTETPTGKSTQTKFE